MRRRLSPFEKKNEEEKLSKQSDAPEQPQSTHEPSVAEVKRAVDSGDKRSLTPRILRRLNQTHGAAYVRRLSSNTQPQTSNLWAKRSSENTSNLWASSATSGLVQRSKLMDTIAPEEEEPSKLNFGNAPTMTDDQAKMQEEHAKMGITQVPFGGMSIDPEIFGQGKDPSMPEEGAMMGMPEGQDKMNFGDAPTMTDDQAKMQEEHAKMGITQVPFGGMSIDPEIFGQGKDPSMPDEDAMMDGAGPIGSETKDDYKDEKYK